MSSKTNGSQHDEHHEDEHDEAALESLLTKHGIELSEAKEIPVGCIRRMEGQPRTDFDEDELTNLRNSVALIGQLQDAMVRLLTPEERNSLGPDEADVIYELVDGERRWIVCGRLHRPVRAKIATGLTAETQYQIAVALNFNRADHNALETVMVIKRLRKTKTVEETAKIIGKSVPTVMNYSGLLKLDPKVFALLGSPTPKDKRIGVTVAHELTFLQPELQWEAYEKMGENRTAHRAKQVVGEIIARDGSALAPGKEPRRIDAHDARERIERYVERGNALVDVITGDAIAGIDVPRRAGLHASLATLMDSLAMLQKTLGKGINPGALDQARQVLDAKAKGKSISTEQPAASLNGKSATATKKTAASAKQAAH